jgi:hypothetical protein
MRNFLSCAAILSMVLLAWKADGAQATKKTAPVKRAAVSKSRKRPASATFSRSVPKTAPRTGTARLVSSKNGKKAPVRQPATTWRNRQMSPSTDRYREIQQALAAKGYLSPDDATGSWNATSADALKKFQSEQNIDASGKINSLSLIALGLGPKREAVTAPLPPPPANDH